MEIILGSIVYEILLEWLDILQFDILFFFFFPNGKRIIVSLHFFLSSYLLWLFFLRAALFEEQIYLINEDDQTDDYADTDTRQLDVSGSVHRGWVLDWFIVEHCSVVHHHE